MNKLHSIYEKFTIGDHLTTEELEEGFDHFYELANLLNVSGPVFRLAFIEANRVAGEFNIFLDNRKADLKAKAEAEMLASPWFKNGYATGIVWTYDYRPGGPFHYSPRVGDTNPEHVRMANESVINHRNYMAGFDKGLADKKAGLQPEHVKSSASITE